MAGNSLTVCGGGDIMFVQVSVFRLRFGWFDFLSFPHVADGFGFVAVQVAVCSALLCSVLFVRLCSVTC